MKTPVTAILFSIFLSFSFECLAQLNTWELLEPGNYTSLISDSNGNIYTSQIANDSSFIIKSTDLGASWNIILTSSSPDMKIYFDDKAANSERLYRDEGLTKYVSSDYGNSWEIFNTPLTNNPIQFTTIGDEFIRYDTTLYRSTDDGVSWTELPDDPANRSFFIIDYSDNLYLKRHFVIELEPGFIIWGDRIHKSTDFGISWSMIPVNHLYSELRVLITPFGDLFISDQGPYETYHFLPNGDTRTYGFYIYSVIRTNFNHLVATTYPFSNQQKIIISKNSGNGWKELSSEILRTLTILSDSLGNIYSLRQNGIYKTIFTTASVFSDYDIIIDDTRIGDTTFTEIIINNPFSFNLEIDSIQSLSENFYLADLESNIIPSMDSTTATIGFIPNMIDTFISYIDLYSELINGRIKVVGYSNLPVAKTIPVDLLQFSMVHVDSSKTKILKVYNESLNDLRVDSIKLKKGLYYYLEDILYPLIIETNDITSIPIAFSPKVKGPSVDSIFIYSYSVTKVNRLLLSGSGFSVAVNPDTTETDPIPVSYALRQNYPNPFNPTTTIEYDLPNDGFISIVIFDVIGNKVATLINEEITAGSYEVEWNALSLPSGIYFYRMRTGNFVETKKLILLK